jgi:hypothetical protein
LEVADIIRQHGAAYAAAHPLSPSQQRVLRDVVMCRTAFLGGHVEQCDHCGLRVYAYHSCRNRHCPKCHTEQRQRWLEQQQARLLACPHYLLTLTLPAELRPLAQAHPREVYGLLLRCAAAALRTLLRDPRWLGATPSMVAVLHTWTRAMLYHPHAHLLVSAGGLSAQGHWLEPKNPAFLAPVRALSIIFRAKIKAALRQEQLLDQAPPALWKKAWVVHAQHVGSGQKTLEYLARYLFRIAMANSRLEALAQGQVTFRYRDNRTQELCRITLSAQEFLRRFLLHLLPRGFPKVRYYGLASASAGEKRERARSLLQAHCRLPETVAAPSLGEAPSAQPPLCPRCQEGHLQLLEILRPRRKFPP